MFHTSGIAPCNGIFQDNGSEGWTVEGNIVYRTADEAVRYNTADTKAEFQKVGVNYLNMQPDAKGFPMGLAREAGLTAPYQWMITLGWKPRQQ